MPFGKWYVHFTLGPGADRSTPGIFPIELTDPMRSALEVLTSAGDEPYPWASVGLVTEGLRQLSAEVWNRRQTDPRLERAIDFMHANLTRKLTAGDVARFAGLLHARHAIDTDVPAPEPKWAQFQHFQIDLVRFRMEFALVASGARVFAIASAHLPDGRAAHGGGVGLRVRRADRGALEGGGA